MAIDYNKINEIAKKYNIPEWIWKPILMTESGGDPNSIASTSSEYSVGLFQINTLAHPQYSKADLLDPYKNANIAFRDFISPAMNYLQELGVTKPVELAEGIYSGINPLNNTFYSADYGGIRPNYTAGVQQNFLGYLKESLPEGLKNFVAVLKIIGGAKDNLVDNTLNAVKIGIEYTVVKSIIQFTLFIMFFVLLIKLFPETTDRIIDTGAKIATKGVV